MVREDVQVVVPSSILGPHTVNLLDLVVYAAQGFEGFRAAYPEVVSDLVIAVVVGIDGWHTTIDIYQASEGLYFPENHVGDDL